jgi:hypothetical protein
MMLEFVEDLEIACSTLCHFGKESFLLWNNAKKNIDACLTHAFRSFRPHSAPLVFLFFRLSWRSFCFFTSSEAVSVYYVRVRVFACVCTHTERHRSRCIERSILLFCCWRIQANAVKWVLPLSPKFPPPRPEAVPAAMLSNFTFDSSNLN